VYHRLQLVAQAVETVRHAMRPGLDKPIMHVCHLEHGFRQTVLEMHHGISRFELLGPIEQSRAVGIGHRFKAGEQVCALTKGMIRLAASTGKPSPQVQGF
jgi:hypothetical protein